MQNFSHYKMGKCCLYHFILKLHSISEESRFWSCNGVYACPGCTFTFDPEKFLYVQYEGDCQARFGSSLHGFEILSTQMDSQDQNINGALIASDWVEIQYVGWWISPQEWASGWGFRQARHCYKLLQKRSSQKLMINFCIFCLDGSTKKTSKIERIYKNLNIWIIYSWWIAKFKQIKFLFLK